MDIADSLQLEFIAYYSMHLEHLHMQASGSKDSRQRDRYSQLIAMIKESPFPQALQRYQQIALADTDSSELSEAMMRKARRMACQDLDLPYVD